MCHLFRSWSTMHVKIVPKRHNGFSRKTNHPQTQQDSPIEAKSTNTVCVQKNNTQHVQPAPTPIISCDSFQGKASAAQPSRACVRMRTLAHIIFYGLALYMYTHA